MKEFIEIDGRRIGEGYPPYIIAELSGNHNGDINRALELIEIAKKSGADAVKLQTYTPDTMTIKCDSPDFKIKGGLWDGYTLYDLYEWAHTPWEWHEQLINRARELGITILSTPFDETSVDFLEKFDLPVYKVASFEAVDLQLIKKIGSLQKPMIISTGMANMEEIQDAVTTAKNAGCNDLVLLHCVSSYPAPADQYNLRTIEDMRQRFGGIIGLSDHTLGITAAIASVSLGADVIEKHFTRNRDDGGPDAAFSLEPKELETLCKEVKIAWEAMGEAGYDKKPCEEANLIFRRSIYVVQDIKKGEELTSENIRCIRPGHGLAPKHFPAVLGKKALHAIKRGTALNFSMFE